MQGSGALQVYPDEATIELYINGSWKSAAQVRIVDRQRGIHSPSTLAYDFNYLEQMGAALDARDYRAVSCRYPLGYADVRQAHWPPFLLDVVPSGAARRTWEIRLGLPNALSSDWPLLLTAGSNPPGNVRVVSPLSETAVPANHPGFLKSDILSRAEEFIEYAHASGAPVSGSTGAGGDSPKFLLRQDVRGRWHADGALADERTRACFIVKFPRTRDRVDRLILQAEGTYCGVARRFGVRTSSGAKWQDDCLFVPRFDRIVQKRKVKRLGVESLCSLAGVADFGVPVAKEKLVAAIVQYTSRPSEEVIEFLMRDVLDVALGNTDNHARNTSVLKDLKGHIALSPVYDLAPMVLDPRGIARVCRWEDGSDFPDWARVLESLARQFPEIDHRRAKRELYEARARVESLPDLMRSEDTPRAVIQQCEPRVRQVVAMLGKAKP